MNGPYNRSLTLTDFIYLVVLFLGINSVETALCWEAVFFFSIISLSLIIDWTSAFTASIKKGTPVLLLADIITATNYLCLYQCLCRLNMETTATYVMYFVHYGIVFTIYTAWNILLLKNNNATKDTVSFMTFFSVIGFAMALCCFVAVALSHFQIITAKTCYAIAWFITGIHLGELLFWVKGTFFDKRSKS